MRAAKLTKSDAAGLAAATKANAADLRAVAKSIRSVDLAVTTDTRKLAAAGAAPAKRATNAKRLAQVSTLKAKLSADASAALSALTAADATLAFDDDGTSADLPDVVSSANQVFDGADWPTLSSIDAWATTRGALPPL